MTTRKSENEDAVPVRLLASFAMEGHCPRCLWRRVKLRDKLPFQVFSTVVGMTDAYAKAFISGIIRETNRAPKWLDPENEIRSYIDPPTWRTFQATLFGLKVRGEADAIFRLNDDSIFIVDYKMSKFSNEQSNYHDLYEAQLNLYAAIWETIHPEDKVMKLALAYLTPNTSMIEDYGALSVLDTSGFKMIFDCNLLPVKRNVIISNLIDRYKFYASAPLPAPKQDCKDCQMLSSIFSLESEKEEIPF